MSDRKKILLTGAGGQLGQEFQFLAEGYPGFALIPVDRQMLDITREEEVRAFFSKHRPDYCINTAAYTAVDKAESEPELAEAVNVRGVGHLAGAGAEAGIPLLHLSSDYVFHTQQNRPYRESDPTAPKGVYARTKLAGEQAAFSRHHLTTVIRTSWVYSSFGHNFVRTMLRLGRQKPELRVVYDQIGTPTYARDLAQAIFTILNQVETHPRLGEQLPGLFHYSNEGVASWYDFALAVFEIAGVDCRVFPILSSDYPTPAPRPPFSVLHKQKIRDTFDLEIPHWRDGLRRCLRTATDDE